MAVEMTFIAVPIYVNDPAELEACLARAGRAIAAGARLIEWRVDALAEAPDAADAVVRLVENSPGPCIVTCRPISEGGSFAGEESSRVVLFESLAAAEQRPRYVDVELAAWRRALDVRPAVERMVGDDAQPRPIETGLILSSHDLAGRPRDLLQRIEAMTNDPACAVVKVAWTARSLRDNLEAFDLLAERRKPTIALCMGRFGLMSRVLAGKFGGFLTFATDAPGGQSAPGQPTIDELRSLYRFDSIGRETKVYGVIGWPVEQSRSPHIHNAGFEAVGHDGVLLPMPIPPEYEHFKATVGAMIDHRRLDFRGAAVTIPHKEHLLRFVLERGGRADPLTERIGAANTLIVGSAGGLACTNTDAPAAIEALCAGMRPGPRNMEGKRVALLGAGGVARAVLAGLIDAGAAVSVFNRTSARAEALAEEFGGRETASGQRKQVTIGEMSEIARERFEIIINCTPIGMAGGPDPGGSPLPADAQIDDGVTVFDTVYAPVRTPLLREAEARGARIVSGMDMFIRQAAMQFEKWTGVPAPMATFETVLRDRT
ncbi:MAG: type I 3-dehydroquinate dehydratase [Planctomycetota bacterium]|nr:type I 3-dehydroquinate dehydratase [Planctomycetota bacterium]